MTLPGIQVTIGVAYDPTYPAKPDFPPILSTETRQNLFGAFEFAAQPSEENPERIKILGGWEATHIVPVEIPQLAQIRGAPKGCNVKFHRTCAKQLQELWQQWKINGLLDRVLTWDGSFVPRFVRGSRKTLSNHAFGTAFDINARYNPRGILPAKVGDKGCVRELVAIANNLGFYWGGHFSRPDGMHFEIAQLRS